ncbi:MULTISPECIES: RNA polymerase sigma factor [unclassified Streptomyces]|uniref:RNA polymerase sigma factor n=1 Tax=unclassified Streptomyces TaxID=2593676 RepID=UPI0007C4CC92|nr:MULTISPECIES: RNA polymerase sigma factor [unclassified Streptomyces]
MDRSLRARIRAGDTQAFARLFQDHAQAVHGHAARWLGDQSSAEDVVSLTFLETWRLRERLLGDREFTARASSEDKTGDGLRAWLFGIATNVLRNTRRALRRHKAALDRLADRHAGGETVPDFADALVDRMEDAERLAAAQAAWKDCAHANERSSPYASGPG